MLVTDIDERKRAENALEKAYAEIRRLTERLRDENVLLRRQRGIHRRCSAATGSL
jgi:hypothetical protein